MQISVYCTFNMITARLFMGSYLYIFKNCAQVNFLSCSLNTYSKPNTDALKNHMVNIKFEMYWITITSRKNRVTKQIKVLKRYIVKHGKTQKIKGLISRKI